MTPFSWIRVEYVAVSCTNQRLFRCVSIASLPSKRHIAEILEVESGAHMCFVDSFGIYASMKYVWAPPLMEVQWYGASNTVMQLKYTME